jgi:hypothetical protein
MMPQRLVVPLFQRPYVWNEEYQWEPLWNDVVRVAQRQLAWPADRHHPHFLGAVVLQQVPNPIGLMQQRTIIDGQQRLTTLQLMLDALHAELIAVNATQPALRLEQLVTNAQAFCSKAEDRFKVWPTNRDRAAFHEVMGATPPVDHDKLSHRGERMVEAHRYFSEQAREWLSAGRTAEVEARATAMDATVRDLLQMVVIDLAVDENAQEIFETLNARGAQLTAADLIKNFVFQRLSESGTNVVEDVYQRHWKDYETAFWETEVNVGRLRYPRSSIFLNHWLIARTGEDVVAREVFTRFKTFADFDAALPMTSLLEQVHRASHVYRRFIDASQVSAGAVERLALFGYRTGVLESEVIKPLVLYLFDPELPPVPPDQLVKALDAIESWMVRRMLVRATTKGYNKFVSEIIRLLRSSDRSEAGNLVERFLARQEVDSQYWPDDEEIRGALRELPIYRRLSRARLRMVLEALEDHCRGWRDGRSGLGGERVARGKYAIEHIMPRKWLAHWPRPNNPDGEGERDRLIHTIGNLTLLTGPMNSKVSNGPWEGAGGKWEALKAHDVLLLNRDLRDTATSAWTNEAIRARTEDMSAMVTAIWRVPAGHRSSFAHSRPKSHRRLDLADLLNAGVLTAGMTLYPGRKKYDGRLATLLPDGQIDVDGKAFPTPSSATAAIQGRRTNGWWFFRVDRTAGRSLRDVLREYAATLPVGLDDDEVDENGDDDADA